MTTPDNSGTHATFADTGDNSNSEKLHRGSNLGRYVIIEPIGSGGMGTVYRAYDPQLNRGVALKILSVKHADLGAAERAKARLIREAQALAQLSHPNVVAVHDAGTFEDDVFIAMELVEGKTLDEWLRQKKRTIKEILEVMIAAGRGLSAAHNAGLIHRDFKPGNVIVGDDGRVRVLDFGLARAADQQELAEEGPNGSEQDGQNQEAKSPSDYNEISSDSSPNLLQSPLTHAGGVLGTPMYMAPEQHLGLKTDERTDQFGFCVVLYEALYGKRPFAGRSMEELKSEVIRQRVIVPRVDTDVPAWLWQIVRKGLSVKPEDRYSTIESLLEDLEKDPEEEGLQKQLARRRKLLVISMAILMVVLPIGVWHGMQYRTVHLCKSAEGEFEGVWDDAIKDDVQEAFLGTEKSYAQETWERVERIFDNYKADWMQMRSEICETKVLKATLSEELFDLQMSCLRKRNVEFGALVKVFTKADGGILQKAIQASSSLTSINFCADEGALRSPYPLPQTLEEKEKVAAIRKKLTDAVALEKTGKYRDGLKLVKRLQEETSQVQYKPVQAEVLYQIGELQNRTGEYADAETNLYSAARLAGEYGDGLLSSKAMASLVFVIGYSQGRHVEGLAIARDAEIVLGFGGRDDDTRARILNNKGNVLFRKKDYDGALRCFQESLTIRVKVLGPEHPDIVASLNNMGIVFHKTKDYDKSLEYYQKSLYTSKKVLGPNHPFGAWPLHNLGGLFDEIGEYDKALECFRKSLAIYQSAVGPEHPGVGDTLYSISLVYSHQANHSKALEYLSKALKIYQLALGAEHFGVAKIFYSMGMVFSSQHNYNKAVEYYRKSLDIWDKFLAFNHPDATKPLVGIGRVYVSQGKQKQALEYLEKAKVICEKNTCDSGPHGKGLFTLARALVVTGGKKVRAIKLAKQARAIFAKSPNAFKKELQEVNTWLQKHGTSKLAKKSQQ